MSAVSDPALVGWVVGGVVLLAAAMARWLLGRLARQYEEMERRVAILSDRLAKAEYAVANDKEGRAAFAETRTDLARLTQKVEHVGQSLVDLRRDVRQDINNLWSRVNPRGGSSAV